MFENTLVESESISEAYNESIEYVSDKYNQVKNTLSEELDEIRVWVDKTVDDVQNGFSTAYDTAKDIVAILVKNTEASAGICIGMGVNTDLNVVGIEGIIRMDIIGILLKDGELRMGHPGKSALDISVLGFTFGPQNETFENLYSEREVYEPSYFDVELSIGAAQAFAIGYHYDFSISLSGILQDLISYFNNTSDSKK